jgi:hypothetical protein
VSNGEPISTYTERLPQVRRELRLYSDRVEIAAKWTAGKDYTMTVSLADLTPQVKRFFVRNRWFKKSILIGSIAVAVAVVLTRPGEYPDWVSRTALLGWPVAGACVLMALWSLPKREFARFSRKDGSAGLDICKAGPDRGRFDEFVQQVAKRIRKA